MNCRGIIFALLSVTVSAAANSGAAALEYTLDDIRLAPGPYDGVRVTQSAWTWGGGPKSWRVAQVDLISGRAHYALRHDQEYGDGQIGLILPTDVNWYMGGMISLMLDGKRISLLETNGETIRLGPPALDRGIAEFSWNDPRGRLTMTFVLFPGDDGLYLQLALAPKTEPTSLAVALGNYPSGCSREGKTYVVAPGGVLRGGESARWTAAEAAWLFLADEGLDAAENPKSAGPSAAVLAPDGLEAVDVASGGYGIHPRLTYRPSTRRFAFCLWEFAKIPNARALEMTKERAARAQARLADPDTFRWPELTPPTPAASGIVASQTPPGATGTKGAVGATDTPATSRKAETPEAAGAKKTSAP